MQKNLLELEDASLEVARRDASPKCGAIAVIIGIALLTAGTPFISTRKWTWEEVNQVCEERYATGHPGFTISDYASNYMFPLHFWTCASMFISLACFCAWLLWSPHQTPLARTLDRKLGSYYALQLFFNITVAASQMNNCTVSRTGAVVGNAVHLFAFWGFSIVASNLLCHRYLLEKADVMCKQVMQGEESRSRWLLSLENLKSSFTWELRVLYLVPIALPFYMAGVTTVALIIGGVTGLGILTTDGIFSTMVTVIFLRPILNILKNDDCYVRQSLGTPENDPFQRMQTTKWMTVGGVALAVCSSSLFYINCLGYFIWFDYFNANKWLNPLIVFGNVDSILNDLGMLMVSVLIKAASWSKMDRALEKPPHLISLDSAYTTLT